MKHKFKMFKNLVIENSLKIENCKLKILIICLFAYLLICLFSPKAFASTSSNNNYNIDLQDIDINPERSGVAPQPYQMVATEPLDKTPDITFGNSAITFSTDNNLIDFGILSPANPVARTVNLSIINAQTQYQLLAFEDHPLSTGSTIIPDTTCEDGQCSEIKESQWINNLTYGFGFRCDDITDSACIGFSTDNNYKQFADSAKQEKQQAIITSLLNYGDNKAKLTFKLNAAGTQKPGVYTNTITFIAVPNY